jgi:hypothetical protein
MARPCAGKDVLQMNASGTSHSQGHVRRDASPLDLRVPEDRLTAPGLGRQVGPRAEPDPEEPDRFLGVLLFVEGQLRGSRLARSLPFDAFSQDGHARIVRMLDRSRKLKLTHYQRFATQEPRAAVLDERRDHLGERFATHEPLAERVSGFGGHLGESFATHEPFAAGVSQFVQALHEWGDVLCERFATRQPLAAVLHEKLEAQCERFATQEPLAAGSVRIFV